MNTQHNNSSSGCGAQERVATSVRLVSERVAIKKDFKMYLVVSCVTFSLYAISCFCNCVSVAVYCDREIKPSIQFNQTAHKSLRCCR